MPPTDASPPRSIASVPAAVREAAGRRLWVELLKPPEAGTEVPQHEAPGSVLTPGPGASQEGRADARTP
jgi:hypothetical protein